MQFLKLLLKLAYYHYVLKQVYSVQASGNSSWSSVLGCGSENGFSGGTIIQANGAYTLSGKVTNDYKGYWYQNYSTDYLLLTQLGQEGGFFNTKLNPYNRFFDDIVLFNNSEVVLVESDISSSYQYTTIHTQKVNVENLLVSWSKEMYVNQTLEVYERNSGLSNGDGFALLVGLAQAGDIVFGGLGVIYIDNSGELIWALQIVSLDTIINKATIASWVNSSNFLLLADSAYGPTLIAINSEVVDSSFAFQSSYYMQIVKAYVTDNGYVAVGQFDDLYPLSVFIHNVSTFKAAILRGHDCFSYAWTYDMVSSDNYCAAVASATTGLIIYQYNCLLKELYWVTYIASATGYSIAAAYGAGYVITGCYYPFGNDIARMFAIKIDEQGGISNDELPFGLTYENYTNKCILEDVSANISIWPLPVSVSNLFVQVRNLTIPKNNFIPLSEYCESHLTEWMTIAPVISVIGLVLIALGFYDEKNRVDAPWEKIEPDAAPSKINETSEGVANHMNAVGLYAHNPMMDSNREKSHVKEVVYG